MRIKIILMDKTQTKQKWQILVLLHCKDRRSWISNWTQYYLKRFFQTRKDIAYLHSKLVRHLTIPPHIAHPIPHPFNFLTTPKSAACIPSYQECEPAACDSPPLIPGHVLLVTSCQRIILQLPILDSDACVPSCQECQPAACGSPPLIPGHVLLVTSCQRIILQLPILDSDACVPSCQKCQPAACGSPPLIPGHVLSLAARRKSL